MATTANAPNVEAEQRLVLTGVRWDQYVRVADTLGDRRGFRLIYCQGRLTLLTKSRPHEWFSRCLGHVVVAVASACGVDWEPAGETTFRREDMNAGVEGDDTFYLGPNAALMRGPQSVDLTVHPAPDLAIEVELTHPADDAMRAYGRIGVPEVWRFDAEAWSLSFWLRQDDGTYLQAPASRAFPALTPADVVEQLQHAERLGTRPWHDQLATWARQVVAPRGRA
jgi:Uma2 family endonuclease